MGEEDELSKLRKARLQEMQQESEWRKQGHGTLRELADEREFVKSVAHHERAVVFLDGDSNAQVASDEVHAALGRIAGKHIEAQFWRLSADKAFFLTHMVELEGYPAIFVLKHGKVVKHLPPSQLFEFSSSTSPLFPRHLNQLLRRAGAIAKVEEEASNSEDDEELRQEEERRRLRRR